MSEPIRVGLWHVVRELRGGFVLRPGAITLALAALAVGLSAAEERITAVQVWSDFLDRIFPPEPEAAHVVLGTIAGSMITVVSVVYSILLVVLTFASTQFSPRVLVAFVEDRVSQTTLGSLHRHVHLLPADPAGGPEPAKTLRPLDRGDRRHHAGDRLPGLPALLHPPHGLVDPGQPRRGPDRPRDGARSSTSSSPVPSTDFSAEEFPNPIPGATPVLATRSGYIRSIDESSLLAAARASDAAMRIDRYIGQFVMEGTPVLEVSPRGPGDGRAARRLHASPSTSARRARCSRTSSSASCRSSTSP